MNVGLQGEARTLQLKGGGSTFDLEGTLAAGSPLAIPGDQDAASDAAGFALFAACSTSLKCSIAAVRLLRRWWNRMSESSLPARRRSASRVISCSRIASPQRSRLRAKLAE